MKSENLEVINKITKYTLRLGYSPIFTFRNNLTKQEDILMIFNDNICLVGDIDKLRTILRKYISDDLDINWYADENELLYVVISNNIKL